MSSANRGSRGGGNNLTTNGESDLNVTKIFGYTERDWIIFDGSLANNSQHMLTIGWIEKLLPLVEGSYQETVSYRKLYIHTLLML